MKICIRNKGSAQLQGLAYLDGCDSDQVTGVKQHGLECMVLLFEEITLLLLAHGVVHHRKSITQQPSGIHSHIPISYLQVGP